MPSTLTQEIDNFNRRFKISPEISGPIFNAKFEHIQSFDPKQAIQPSVKLPAFTLSDANGKIVSSHDLITDGPLLINFYRGDWCPYCNMALNALRKCLPEIQARGVTLVAISPELPNNSLTIAEKNNLQFPVLSDVGNKYARKLGIINQMPDEMRPIMQQIGVDLKEKNGDDSFALPIPAVLLVDGEGTVRNVHLDTDYMKRLEPDVIIGWIDAMLDDATMRGKLGER